VSDCDLELSKIRGHDPDLGSGATGKILISYIYKRL
jgi:hypothetical protein